ncbi:hypothetical protein Zm00014a_031530, partial [Zea mays]
KACLGARGLKLIEGAKILFYSI